MPDPDHPPDLDVTIPVAAPSPATGTRQQQDIPSPEELELLLPHGNYSVEGFLGQGGMGAVYRGTQVRLQRQVAIKIMRRDHAQDQGFEERFRREALAMAQLNHPNIVNVIDYGEAGPDYLYIVMEFIDGSDLVKVIRSGEMTQETALRLLPQICDALQFAHDHGIVHRDIKPANILLTRDGRIKMADFGLAKRFDAENSYHTQTGYGMGTPDYAAPEQFMGDSNVDHRADIYALGVMIYQMVTGTLPRGAWKPPSEKAAVNAFWDHIVARALQTDPHDRYASVSEIKTDLSGITPTTGAPRLAEDGTQVGKTSAMTAAKSSTTALTQAGGRPVTKAGPTALQNGNSQSNIGRKRGMTLSIAAIVLLAGGYLARDKFKPAPMTSGSNFAALRTWSPSTATITVGTEWTDIIPHIQPERDAVRGDWESGKDGLACVNLVRWSLLKFPVQPPADDYEVRYKLTRTGGPVDGLFFPFLHGDAAGSFAVDYPGHVSFDGMRRVALQEIKGRATLEKPSEIMAVRKEWIPFGKTCTVLLQVSAKEVRVLVDNVEAIRWQADWSQIQQSASGYPWAPVFQGLKKPIFGIGMFNSAVVYHSIEMRRVGEAKASASASTPHNATKDAPFENTLGMKFVPVPGIQSLFCTHETRVRDYTAFDAEQPDILGLWRLQHQDGVPAGREPDHPVVGVTWEDARRFCEWLGKKEGRTYRLPTDREWSFAAGIAAQEPWTAEALPEQINMRGPDRFEWGAQLPPPDGSGNFADMSCKQQFPGLPYIEGYEDGFPTTAPVGRFKPNQLGLYDMLGNAAEWCEDWFEKSHATKVLRGQGWRAYQRTDLFHTARMKMSPQSRTGAVGFRCVLVPDEGVDRTKSAPLPETAIGADWTNIVPHIKPERDAMRGEWTVDGGSLSIQRAPWAVCRLPVQDPGTDYDLRCRITRGEGDHRAMFFFFEKGNTGAYVAMDYINPALPEFADGQRWLRVEGNPENLKAKRKEWLPRGKACTVLLQVRDKEVIVFLDDEEVFRTPADWSRLGQGGGIGKLRFADLTGETIFGVGVYDCHAIFHSIEMRRVGESKATAAASTPTTATKEAPFENTLGMKFVPVPITGGPTDGKRVLFSVWPVRAQDFDAFLKEQGQTRPKTGFEEGPAHPAVGINWSDAQAFCAWLTTRERAAGKLGEAVAYRLPSDHEWSCALEIGAREDADKPPAEKHMGIPGLFPWGTQWPPPKNAGNFADEEMKPALAAGKYANIKAVISGYNDGFVNTAPVGSFPVSRLGLHDMSGNVWQWCEDWADASRTTRVLRGGSSQDSDPKTLHSTYRNRYQPEPRFINHGFRVVLEAR